MVELRWFKCSAGDAEGYAVRVADCTPIIGRRLVEATDGSGQHLAVLRLDATGRPDLTDLVTVGVVYVLAVIGTLIGG